MLWGALRAYADEDMTIALPDFRMESGVREHQTMVTKWH